MPLLAASCERSRRELAEVETLSENTVCSCKQMAGNYLQFAVYADILLLPLPLFLSLFLAHFCRLTVSFSWLFSALSFHPGAIHRLPGNCQRSAPRNAGVAGQQRVARGRHISALIYVFPPGGTTEGGTGISLPQREISALIQARTSILKLDR